METKFVYYSLDRARNGEHFDFIRTFLSTFSAEKAAALGLSDRRFAMNDLFGQEDDAIKQIQSYNETAAINEFDAQRDELFRYLTQEVKNQQRSPIATRKKAADHLAPLTKTYAGAADKTQRDETGLLVNFITDLQRPPYANDVAALSLTEVVTAMKEANDAFDEAFHQRVDEKDYRRAADSMKTIRPQVDRAYQDMLTMLNSLWNVYSLTPEDFAEKLVMLENLSAPLNANANDLKQAIDIREAGGSTPPKPGPIV